MESVANTPPTTGKDGNLMGLSLAPMTSKVAKLARSTSSIPRIQLVTCVRWRNSHILHYDTKRKRNLVLTRLDQRLIPSLSSLPCQCKEQATHGRKSKGTRTWNPREWEDGLHRPVWLGMHVWRTISPTDTTVSLYGKVAVDLCSVFWGKQ